MSPSFGGRSQVMNVNDLVISPQVVLDSLSTTESIPHSNPIAPTNMDTDSLVYFIMSSSRWHTAVNRSCIPSELAWLKSPTNVLGYALYQDIDHTTVYGRLSLEMCAIAQQVDYHYFYRQATSLPCYHSSDSEFVKTNHIFSQWVDGILSQFQTRYPRIFDCLFKPDPFNDQSVREYYIQIMHTNVHKWTNST